MVGQVDAVTPLSPVDKAGKGERSKTEVVGESHLVVRQSIAGEADDLVGRRAASGCREWNAAADERLNDRGRLTFLNEHVSEGRAEGSDARVERGHRQTGDLALGA